ncbi:MAG: xanthine dehydrogenase molybdopterin binding subunit, partial [Alphaproteobacteria bacterium]|nr:xanthine dehydrogenase molybdopterin binding subunit [Alphaproteobacteria bacterium]
MTGPALRGHMHHSYRHDSAAKHVTGRAAYADDIVEPAGMLHAYLGLSTVAHADILELDLTEVRNAPGVVGVLTAADIPGENDISPTGAGDDPVFADRTVSFHGQPIFAVIAGTRAEARHAARLARVAYEPRQAVIGTEDAVETVSEPLTLARGNVEAALAAAPRRLQGTLRVGGQDHFYLEGHIAFALPGEDDEVRVVSSTQHPSEVQHIVAHVLEIPSSAVTVNVRRMGGAFGGKESQSNLFAAVAALAARKFGQAVKLRPDRDDDMTATGKRHDFRVDYDVGFDDKGHILAVDSVLTARCGFSVDLSSAVSDRALFHADNAYFFPAVRLRSRPMRTNTVSNTAFRGFGAPQGVMAAERIIEEVAYCTGMSPLDVRKANFYGGPGRDMTPYHQPVEDNILVRLVAEIEERADYESRCRAVLDFNARGGVLRRGLALTPVKFGVSFTATWMNQAGALVHVYRDGSIHLNHGGTEMGQGLFIKVASVVADCFQVDLDCVRITATSTGKVPNTSATAASTGSDLNGMAAFEASEEIKRRLVAFAAEHWRVEPDRVTFEAGRVRIGHRDIAFAELLAAAS